jgi:DNA-binding response OmpR family regulator
MVLVVEDDQLFRLWSKRPGRRRFESAITASGESNTLLRDDTPRAVVTDINLIGRIDGWEVARAARETDPTIPVVYMTEPTARNGPLSRPERVILAKPLLPRSL